MCSSDARAGEAEHPTRPLAPSLPPSSRPSQPGPPSGSGSGSVPGSAPGATAGATAGAASSAGWRRSLLLKLTLVQALAVGLTFLVVGTALYKVKEGRLIHDDQDLLRRYAESLAFQEPSAPGPLDRETLEHRLDDLRLIHTELVLEVRKVARADPAQGPGGSARGGTRLSEARTERHGGRGFEVLDLALADPDGSITAVTLRLPTSTREQILKRYLSIITIGTIVGVLASVTLSVLVIRRWGRRLRRLSAEAREAAGGGRIAATHVDAELSELVAAFNGTVDELEQARHQSEAFSADVAHELRSPLATLIGGTQLALSRPRSVDELREALASNLEELERLKTLVNDMLFLARADQGERASSLEQADLATLADATVDYCTVLLDEAGLSARRVGEASAVCNEGLIRRAMANLLSNAIQHCSADGRIELHLAATGSRVRIWVFNSGAPLGADIAARIFDRFFRANEARTDHDVHHGLGLAIVAAVARMHGGEVFAEPRPDGNAIGLDLPGDPAFRDPGPLRSRPAGI